jgi:LacI family transcriptional regulator
VNDVTIRDVARAADVSVATVSRTLNGIESVAAETRDRVLRAADELDYVPNSGARALSTRRTDTIGVLLPDLHGEFFSELIRGIDLAARARGLHLLLSSSHGDPAEAAAALRAMRSRVDSIIVMVPHVGGELLAGVDGASVPMVFVGRTELRGAHLAIAIDNYAGAFAITEHLVSSGRTAVAFVAGPADNLDASERLRGYRAAAKRFGTAEWIIDGDFTEQAGRDAASAVINGRRPDALFCSNDMMAIGALEALKEAGVAVPDGIALAGFDDIPISRYVSPPLTTAAVPIAEIGRQALECCAAAVAGGKPEHQRTFKPELVVRASTSSNSNHDNKRMKMRGIS